MTDEELVGRFVESGDRWALEQLVGRYSDKLRRLLYSLLGADVDRVRDAEQEVYMVLVERIGRFRGDARFSTFLYSLARNKVLDIMRAARRRNARSTVLDFPDTVSSAARGPEQNAVRASDASMLRMAMDAITPDDRFLLYMKDAEDESIADLARVTGQREGTVKSRLSRARARVRQRLEELGYER